MPRTVLTPGESLPASPAPSVALPSRPSAKSQRVLACILCQSRKVKCDRKFPCANCVRAGTQCVSTNALAPRPRRRRFPERELLDRVRRYEGLLRENNIEFEPLHPSNGDTAPSHKDGQGTTPDHAQSDDDERSSDQTHEQATLNQPINVWDAMNHKSPFEKQRDDDESDEEDDSGIPSLFVVREKIVKQAMDNAYESHDNILFQVGNSNAELSSLHPGQAQIFKLWQIYLENVDPLLKVTHTPTLQSRVIDAAGDIQAITPTLEALLFGIYAVAVLSLEDDACFTMLKSPRKELLSIYQYACQQALQRCGALRTNHRDCLTALYLCMIASYQTSDPRVISATFGAVMRTAQRMGLASEASYAKHPPLEAEMRRRLWWSLVFFDNRICEMGDVKASSLNPTWQIRIPLMINDSDLRPELKTLPTAYDRPTEAIFAMVRSEMSNYVRHCAFRLDFANPLLKPLLKKRHDSARHDAESKGLSTLIEDKYLKLCDMANPLHFMTVWTARGYIAKCCLMEHYATIAKSPVQQTDAQRDTATSHALLMLECDTRLLTSPMTKGFLWYTGFQFPFPAYVNVVHDLRRRPNHANAARIWKVLDENYEARFSSSTEGNGMFYKVFSSSLLRAWEVYAAGSPPSGQTVETPYIIHHVKNMSTPRTQSTQKSTPESLDAPDGLNLDDFFMPMQVDFSTGFPYDISGLDPTGQQYGQAGTSFDVNHFDINNTNGWTQAPTQGWG